MSEIEKALTKAAAAIVAIWVIAFAILFTGCAEFKQEFSMDSETVNQAPAPEPTATPTPEAE